MSHKLTKKKVIVRYITPGQIARAVGKTPETIRIWLRNAGCLIKRNGHYYTTAELALVHFPSGHRYLRSKTAENAGIQGRSWVFAKTCAPHSCTARAARLNASDRATPFLPTRVSRVPSRTAKPRVRTFDASNHSPRFRPETVVPSERKSLSATIGERCIARQLARLEAAVVGR